MVNENKFEIKKLTIKQVIIIYYRYLKKDFPPSERRFLFDMIRGIIAKRYECFGAFYKGRMLGYAFFIKSNNDYLLDYLAINGKFRDKGLGTIFVNKLKEHYKDADSLIIEVENPDAANNSTERATRERRLEFYIRNGGFDTNVRTNTFGVAFIILQIVGKPLDAQTVKKLYRKHYRFYYSEKIYRKNVHFCVLESCLTL